MGLETMIDVLEIQSFSLSAHFDIIANGSDLVPSTADFVSYGHLFPKRRLIPEIMAEVLSEHPGVTVKMIISVDRRAPVVRARHHIWHQIREERADISFAEIGRRFRRDHSTVIHGIAKHALLMGRGMK